MATQKDLEPALVRGIEHLVKDGAVIQGGSFRVDKGPTATETAAFELAVALHALCARVGRNVRLCLIVNDLGLAAAGRPKVTGMFAFPAAYLAILEQYGVEPDGVLLVYESWLRNRVRKDCKAVKRNRQTGIQVAVCANIMGRYYQTLAELGHVQQVGFYAREPKPEAGPDEREDTACHLGPLVGAVENRSGYRLRVNVLNYSVLPDGSVRAMCNLGPDSEVSEAS